MAVSDIESVLGFLRKNGLAEAETALKQDILAKGDLGSVDFEIFEFPMSPPPPPPVRIGRFEGVSESGGGSGSNSDSSSDFVSMGSFKTDGFTNPYGIRNGSRVRSEASSADFGTARDYYDSDLLNDVNWYDEKDDDYLKPSYFGRPDFHVCPSEDKFVTTSEEGIHEESSGLNLVLEGFHSESSLTCLDKSCPNTDYEDKLKTKDCYHWGETIQHEQGVEAGLECHDKSCGCSVPLCDCCVKLQEDRGKKSENFYQHSTLEESNVNDNQSRYEAEAQSDYDFMLENQRNRNFIPFVGRHMEKDLAKEDHQIGVDEKISNLCQDIEYDRENCTETAGESNGIATAGDGEECNTPNELKLYESHEDEYDVFNLRIIHRKNRTGFEENKDLPIVINAIIAGRYYVTEYLGSAAFSKVVQAHDLQTGVDVCLKIIKNDKDFFDQSLDEIKLLKFVNKHDPADKRHILRLYDYFYHQEHLFIVCELLRANLYEFLKYNQDSGGEAYFTVPRLQKITQQCLEALEYLHGLGIIHCDLKPENILIKSYSRCEIKVIDLGSSCFQTDNLCLYVQSRSYRAPEVILGSPYDQKVDIWSLGCILAELCSGDVLFPNESLVTLLVRMIGMFGPIDMEMLVKGQETHKYFTKDYEYLYDINEETDELMYLTPEETSLENHMKVSDTEFVDFVKYLLEMNPRRRPTAAEALQHPWLSHSYG